MRWRSWDEPWCWRRACRCFLRRAGATVEMQNQAKTLGFAVKNCLYCHASPHAAEAMQDEGARARHPGRQLPRVPRQQHSGVAQSPRRLAGGAEGRARRRGLRHGVAQGLQGARPRGEAEDRPEAQAHAHAHAKGRHHGPAEPVDESLAPLGLGRGGARARRGAARLRLRTAGERCSRRAASCCSGCRASAAPTSRPDPTGCATSSRAPGSRSCWCTGWAATRCRTGDAWWHRSAGATTSTPRTCRASADPSARPRPTTGFRCRSRPCAPSWRPSACSRARVVGNSMGGWIVARLAGEHPELVERLVAVAPAGMRPVDSAPIPAEVLLPHDEDGVRRLVAAVRHARPRCRGSSCATSSRAGCARSG